MSAFSAPVGDTLPFLGTLFPTESLGYFLLEFGPLLYVVFVPLLAGLMAAIGLCAGPDGRSLKFGARTAMRRVMLAVRAETRMGIDTKHTQLLAKAGFKNTKGPAFMQPTASAVQGGLDKAKARGSPGSGKKK